VKRTTPGTHTAPPVEDDQPPTHAEVAEVVGRMWIALIAQDAVGRRKRRKEASRA
jgi:hypothetical protein